MPRATVRIVEIAELLGVSKQRAHQLAAEDGFPASVAVLVGMLGKTER